MKKNYGYRVRNDKEVIASPLFEGDKIFDDETQEMWEIENNKHWRSGNIALAALKAMSIVMMSSTGGASGQQGVQGVPGADGNDGLPGADGTNGTDGVDGAVGHDGSQGVPGIDGIDGTNGTGVVIMGHEVLGTIQATDGTAGDMWIDQATGHGWVSNGLGAGVANWLDIGQIEGPTGPTGATGQDGSQGIPGVDGADGAPGVDGSDGVKGDQGDQGIPGVQGVPGVDGQDGVDGQPGIDGTNGIDGVDAIDTFTVVDKSGVDLDTLTDNGLFFANGSNRPLHTQSGVLEIRLDEVTGHTIQTFQSSAYTSFVRAYDGAGWSTWEQTETSNMLGLLMHMIMDKANKSSLPTLYSGEAIPLDTLGKDYDRYHQYEAGSAVTIDLYDGTSIDGYNPNIFTLMADFKGSPVQNDIVAVEVAPFNHVVFIDLNNNAVLPVEELTLQIDGTDIPLTVISNAAGSLSASYDQTSDAVMESIVPGTSFKIVAKEGVSTPQEHDWEKHNGHWERQDFLTEVKINEIIREYSTIVEQVLADQKKPTRDEALTAFKALPHHDWTKNDTFYIRDTVGANKMVFCTYISDGATDETSAGPIFFKDMMETV